jgi:hypothetical protein
MPHNQLREATIFLSSLVRRTASRSICGNRGSAPLHGVKRADRQNCRNRVAIIITYFPCITFLSQNLHALTPARRLRLSCRSCTTRNGGPSLKNFNFHDADRLDTAAFNRVLWQGIMGNVPYTTVRTGLNLRKNRAQLLKKWGEEKREFTPIRDARVASR